MICRHCGEEIQGESSETASYWWVSGSGPQAGPVRDVCHPSCKRIGEALEAFKAQDIDRSCNYCRYFERDKSQANKDKGENHLSRVFTGKCGNSESRHFGKEVSGHAGSYSLMQPECFVNRRGRPTNNPELIAIAQYNICRMMLLSSKAFVEGNLQAIQDDILSIK